jgi:hypothetical protein
MSGERSQEAVGLTKNVIRRLVCDHLPGNVPGQNEVSIRLYGREPLYFPVN